MGSCQGLPRARRGGRRSRAAAACAVVLVELCGCGRGRSRSTTALSFQFESDTSGLSQGPELLTSFDPVRYPNGLLQLRGGLRFPDSTRVQISVVRKADGRVVARVQVPVIGGRFVSDPLLGLHGPLPVDTYRFEFLAEFNAAWQSEQVLAETDQGRRLRGPGMVRGGLNEAAFQLTRELRE